MLSLSDHHLGNFQATCSFFSSSEKLDLNKGNQHCPLFTAAAQCLSTQEACTIILNPGKKVCTQIPCAYRTDTTFVLNMSCFQHHNDFKADDNGSFRNHGRKYEFVEMDDDVSQINYPKDMRPSQYKYTRTYWVHNST